MADEEKNEQNGQPEGDAGEEQAAAEAAAPEASPAEETAAAEDASDTAASGEDAAAEGASGEGAAAAEDGGDGGPGEGAAAEELSPKERRKRERSRHAGEARPQRGPEERARERAEARRRRVAERRRWRLRRRERQRAERDASGPATTPPVEAGPHGRRRVRQGVVVSDKPDKTITVRIDVTRRHRTYKKIVRESSTLHAHDERNEAHEGDTVRVVESRPLSRTKRWRLAEVLERAR